MIVVAVRMAIPDFITRSMRTWDPSRSCIDTYFVNYCLLKFRTAYAQLCREEAQASTETPARDVIELESRRSAADNVEDVVIARRPCGRWSPPSATRSSPSTRCWRWPERRKPSRRPPSASRKAR